MTDFSFKPDEETPPEPATPGASPEAPSKAASNQANSGATKQAPAAPAPPLPKVPVAPTPQVPLSKAPTASPSTAATRSSTSAPAAPSPGQPAGAAPTPSPAVPSPVVPSPPMSGTGKPGTAKPAGAAPQRPPGAPTGTATAPGSRPAAPRPAQPAVPTPQLPGMMSPAQQAAAVAGDPTTGELARSQMQTSARERVGNKDVPLWRQWLDSLDPLAYWLLRIAGAGAVISIAYILWGVFGGQIGTMEGGADPQVVQNIALASNILKWSLFALVISAFILMFDAAPLGIATAVLGAALQFGSPLLLKSIGQTPAIGALAIQLIMAGKVIFVLGLIKTALDTAAWLSELPNRMQQRADVGVGQMAEVAQQRAARSATMFSPCWQLPFCREVIRKQCPAYLAKTRCWKFGRGCYCDEEMISRIIRGESLDMIKAPTRMSRQGKPPCGRCYIFLEHQTLKYKMFSPLAIPATIIIMYFGWSTYERMFGVLGNSLTSVWEKLSFAKSTVTTTVTTTTSTPGMPDMSNYQLSPESVQIAAMNMFGFLLGFFLLIYLSKAVEWAIYKAKL